MIEKCRKNLQILQNIPVENQVIMKYELIQVDRIENSPFNIVNKNGKIFVTCGKYRSKDYKNYEDAQKAIKEKDWNLLAIFILSFTEELENK